MATILQNRRGNSYEASTFILNDGEFFIDKEKNKLYVHDGETLGGHPINPNLNTINGKEVIGEGDIILMESNFNTITEDYLAVANDYLFIDTRMKSFTLTLPANPLYGDVIRVFDNFGTFKFNNLKVDGNGNKIMGHNCIMKLNVNNLEYRFMFNGDEWRVTR